MITPFGAIFYMSIACSAFVVFICVAVSVDE